MIGVPVASRHPKMIRSEGEQQDLAKRGTDVLRWLLQLLNLSLTSSARHVIPRNAPHACGFDDAT